MFRVSNKKNVFYINYVTGALYRFQDGTSGEFDVIIYATGYLNKYPFIDPELSFASPNRMAIPLYKGIVLPTNHKLFYVGMQNNFFNFAFFWLQSVFCAQVIQGKTETVDR